MTIASSVKLQRHVCADFYETVVGHEDGEELYITARPKGTEDLGQMLERVGRRIREAGVKIATMTVVEGAGEREAGLASLRGVCGEIAWPITWVQGEDAGRSKVLGVEVVALRGPAVRPLTLRGRVIGCTWETSRARHCVLGDLRDEVAANSVSAQTQRVLEDMVAGLGQCGMTFANVYRTWFRNRDILAWYREFNQVRTAFYGQLKVFDGVLPASTGIGAGNPFGAALVAGVGAMESKGAARAHVVESPMQNAALKYGSSFSRAVEVDDGDHRLVTISGTASIDAAGRTVHVGDVRSQVDLTMEVVRAILRARGLDWADVVRGLAYFRRAEDIGELARWCAEHGGSGLPVIANTHTVCRDDLLYEIEVDAM